MTAAGAAAVLRLYGDAPIIPAGGAAGKGRGCQVGDRRVTEAADGAAALALAGRK